MSSISIVEEECDTPDAGADADADATLSAKMRRLAFRQASSRVQQREVVRLHGLVRAARKAPGCVHLQRGRELELAVREPRLPLSGLSRALFAPNGGMSEDAVLFAVEYEIDDGGSGHQQHGDLLFWEPGDPGDPGDPAAPQNTGRWVAVECKRLTGGPWVESHAAQRCSGAERQATRIAARLRSWLSHLCAHDDSLRRSAAMRDGARCVVAATLTEAGISFRDVSP